MGKRVKEDDFGFVADTPETQQAPPAPVDDFGFTPDPEPVKKKSTPTNLVEKQPTTQQTGQEIPTTFSGAVGMGSPQPTKPSSKDTEAMSKWNLVNDALQAVPQSEGARGVYDLIRTAYSGVTDQIPKEYYVQRLRMSKGDLGDLLDKHSDYNQFGDKLPEIRVDIKNQFGEEASKKISREEFSKWSGENSTRAMLPYNTRAEMFFREKLGATNFSKFVGEFKEENLDRRLGFEKEIQRENKEAASKTGGIIENVKDIKGASDFLSFAGNMIGQAGYRAPMALATGPTGSIISESAAVYDRQLDIIAETHGISREEVIKKNMDAPAAGQALAVALGGMDALSSFNILGLFRKAATGQVKKNMAKEFVKAIAKEAIPEGATEAIQSEGEEFAAAQGAETEYKFDPWRFTTSFAGGAIGGAVLGGASPTPTVQEQVKEQTEQIPDTNNPAAINAAAANIQQAVENPVSTTVTQDVTDQTIANAQQPPQTSQANTEGQTTPPVDSQLPESVPDSGQHGGAGSDAAPIENADTPPVEEAGREPKMRKKALENRAHQGAMSEGLKTAVESHGLKYRPEKWDEARRKADSFIEEVGIPEALTAVRNAEVDGGTKAYIYSRAIDDVEARLGQTSDPAEIQQLQEEQADLIAEFGEQERNAGRFISILQDVYANADTNYAASQQIEKYKAVNKGMITPEVERKFQDLEAKLKESNQKIQEYERKRVEREDQDYITYLKKQATKQRSQKAKAFTAQNKKQVTDLFDNLKIKDVGGTANDITRVVGVVVWNGAMETVKQATLAGFDIANAVQAGVRYIQDNFKGEGFDPEEFRQMITPRLHGMEPKEQKSGKKSGKTDSTESTPSGPSIGEDGKISIPNAYLISLVEQGHDTIQKLTDEVHSELSKTNPGVTTRQVRDAITKYGRSRKMSQDQIKTKLRELKDIGRMVSALEDVEQKQERPKKSGLQRDKPTDEQRRMRAKLNEAMKDLPVDQAESDRLQRNALDQVKARLKNRIKDLEEQIQSGKKIVSEKKEIEYDQEAKDLQSQRDELQKEFDEIFGKPEMSDEKRLELAVKAANRSKEELERRIKERDFSTKKKPSPSSPELDQARKNRDALREIYNDLLKDAGEIEKRRLGNAKKAVQKQIQEYQRRIAEKDFEKKKFNEISPDDELLNLKAEKQAIKEQFNQLQYENELKNRSNFEKGMDYAIEAWNLTRALRATLDFSAMFVQGGLQTISHPVNAAKAFLTAAQHAFSEKKAAEWLNKLRAHEAYSRMKDSKLAITEPNAKLAAREEQFLGGWVNLLWDMAGSPLKLVSKKFFERYKALNPVKALERATIGYLNTLRVLRYLQGEEMIRLKKMKDDPDFKSTNNDFRNNPEDYKNIADVINTFTGRASLGALENMSKPLSVIFFSPRNWASVLKQATPYALIHFGMMTSKNAKGRTTVSAAQKMAMGDYMKYVGLTAALVMLVKGMEDDDDKDGWKVEMDPTSSDFLKLRKGDTRIDPWGGRIQLIVLQARLILGSMKVGGKVKKLGKARNKTELDLLSEHARNKLAPSAAILYKYLNAQKKRVDGEEKRMYFGESAEIPDLLWQNIYPIYWDTVVELYKDQPGTVATFISAISFFGMGTQTYGDKKKKKE